MIPLSLNRPLHQDNILLDLTMVPRSVSVSKACVYPFNSSRFAYFWKNGSLNQVTLAALQNMLHDINPYVQVFQQTGRLLQQNSQNLTITMIITDSRMTDSQCYNVPTTSEIAAIIVGDNNNPSNVSNCDIILHSHEGGLHCI